MTEQITDRINRDYDDDAPDAEAPPPAPRPRPRAQAGTVPAYLRDLLAMPGVDPGALDGVPVGTAWVKIESANGAARQMPLAFLAPEALDTLADLGFENHTTFEIRGSQSGPVLRYFACQLDELEPEEQAEASADLGAGDARLIELLTRQQIQINALTAKIEAAGVDPFAGLEKSFALFERFGKIMARVVPPALPAAGNDLARIIDVVGQVAPLFNRGAGGGGAQAEAPDLPPEPEPEE